MTTVTDVSPVSDEQVPLQTVDLRSRILSIDDIPTEIVTVPEWNGIRIEVRGMTGGDRASMMAEAIEDGEVNFEKMYPDIVIRTCYDPDTGARIFTEADRGALNGKSGKVIDRLASVGQRLSGMDGKAVDDAGKDS